MKKLTETVENLEEIQYVQIELTDQRRKRVNDSLEKLNHKLHSLSNLYMAMEEKINELAAFATQLKAEIDDLRQSIESLDNRSDTDSES
jgi:chromosome segregation ATPase